MEVRDLNVGDLLGLLESPQEEVCQEVHALLKETFSSVREAWLISGLLEYFYVSNSGRLLDLLLCVSEPHDRHLLDKLMEGLKGTDRFRHTCIMLYAVRRQPSPMWLRKFLGHGAMRELLHVLMTGEDVPVLVGSVMVLVILLPIFPLEMGRLHLTNILEVFCRLVRWTPKRELDADFQPFLQVAVYSLFHRLYALYPCHFLTCLRVSFSKPNSGRCFFSTLKPMMEKVRLHPLLITETKESEVTRNRWIGLETHQLILECAKLCLDPLETTCEDVCGSFFVLSTGNEMALDALPVPTNWLLYAVENNFWSPSLSLSSPSAPSSLRGSMSSMPQTPVYTISTPTLKPVGGRVAESPPEAAIEATPETTPFTSPMKMEASVGLMTRRPTTAVCALTLNTAVATRDIQMGDVAEGCTSPLSPVKKDQSPFKFPDDQCQDIFSRAGKSTLIQTKLKQILKERQQCQRDGDLQVDCKGEKSEQQKEISAKDVRESAATALSMRKLRIEKLGSGIAEAEVTTTTKSSESKMSPSDVNRRRKISVYDGSRNVDLAKLVGVQTDQVGDGGSDLDFISDASNKQNNETDDLEKSYCTILDRRISEEKESESGDSRRSSDETQPCERETTEDGETVGLGVPNQRLMTDLVKNMKTMRLRFLSQCGPPPDLSQYNLAGGAQLVTSPSKPGNFLSRTLHKTLSCPDLSLEVGSQVHLASEGRLRKLSAMSSLTLSPIRQAVVTCEATTQTEEITVINPYEQLLDALMSGPTSVHHPKTFEHSTNDTNYSPSPHELLDRYLQHCSKAGDECKNILWQQTVHSGSQYDALKNQVRLVQIVLLIERHKREVHAERNRRLLGRAKKVYALEEQQLGLKERVAQLEGEIAQLKLDLQNAHLNSSAKEQQLQSTLSEQHAKVSQILVERDDAKEQRELLKQRCNTLSRENALLNLQIHKSQAHLLEKERQLNVHARLTDDNDTLRNQVDILHKQVCLMGEVQDQYKQEVWKLTMSGGPGLKMELERERAAARRQMEDLEEQCRITSASLDAMRSQVSDLELSLQEKNRLIEEQQQAVKAAREIGAEQCHAVELRCQALASTNQTLETFILEQNDRIDRLVRQVRRSQRGKSVCSDGLDFDLELSASPPSASSGDSTATSPPAPDDTLHPSCSLLASQQIILNKLDVLAEAETETDGASSRRKT